MCGSRCFMCGLLRGRDRVSGVVRVEVRARVKGVGCGVWGVG